MSEFLFLDVVAIIAGVAAIHFILKAQKHFGLLVQPAFQLLTTVIGLLMATIVAKYFVEKEGALSALNNAVIIGMLLAICMAMWVFNQKMPRIKR